jgi:hypothetical protein
MKTALLLLVVVIIAACTPMNQSGCTEEAKLCPDGTSVGRVPPSCEFAPCPQAPAELGTFKQYISQDAEQCSLIRYVCASGEAFSDDTGCGCVVTRANAAVTLCATDYDPVCGWSDESIQCFAYPCAQTYSNICLASVEPNVAYTTPGECPTVGSNPGQNDSHETRKYVSTDLQECRTILFQCAEGRKPFFDDSGCGCQYKSEVECTDPRPEACTKEYMPVCGQKADGTSSTYGNSCSACGDREVLSYVEDEC